jgi:hypothetical protein
MICLNEIPLFMKTKHALVHDSLWWRPDVEVMDDDPNITPHDKNVEGSILNILVLQ